MPESPPQAARVRARAALSSKARVLLFMFVSSFLFSVVRPSRGGGHEPQMSFSFPRRGKEKDHEPQMRSWSTNTLRKEACFHHDSASHGCVTVRRVFPCGPGNAQPDQLRALRRYGLSPEAVVHALRVLIGTAPLSLVQFGGIIAPAGCPVNREMGILAVFLKKVSGDSWAEPAFHVGNGRKSCKKTEGLKDFLKKAQSLLQSEAGCSILMAPREKDRGRRERTR